MDTSAPPLPHPPRLSLNGGFLMTGGYAKPSEREQAYAVTRGSQDWLWTGDDEIRFQHPSGDLHSLFLHVPPLTDTAAGVCASWPETRIITGGLRLSPARNFELPATQGCWSSPDGGALAAHYGSGGPARGERVRLRIAPCLDLVFVGGLLSGWLLERPERFLVTDWEPHDESPPDPVLAGLLRAFLPYLAEPLIDRITDDADPGLLAELRALETRTQALGSSAGRAPVLAAAIRKLIEDWY
ncbi:hypothetical protein [Streptomyces aidingensis]|uniref:hypothetical protein n=1 Tax=Streptomyces aidingensis TaxID=910347 RepID=UPI001587D46F|nr:hypothetical protein [Streptomyces aidingensis]